MDLNFSFRNNGLHTGHCVARDSNVERCYSLNKSRGWSTVNLTAINLETSDLRNNNTCMHGCRPLSIVELSSKGIAQFSDMRCTDKRDPEWKL